MAGGERLRRLLIARENLLPEIGEPRTHRRISQRLRDHGIEPGDDGHRRTRTLAVRKPFAEQLLDHSAVYPPSPRWGALEGANIFDGEIQNVMKGKETPEEAAKSLAEKMDEEFAG